MAGPIRVYFDHNVVDHAVKRHKITDGQVDQLRSIGKSGIFQLMLSITNLDEIIAGLQSRRPLRPEQAIEQLRLIRDVIGFGHLLKPPDQLLTHALVDFAFDLPPSESVRRGTRGMSECGSGAASVAWIDFSPSRAWPWQSAPPRRWCTQSWSKAVLPTEGILVTRRTRSLRRRRISSSRTTMSFGDC